jgi:hypothetical protein
MDLDKIVDELLNEMNETLKRAVDPRSASARFVNGF